MNTAQLNVSDEAARRASGKAEFLVHGKCRKSDIHAIQKGDEVTQDQKWNEAPRGLTRCASSGSVADIHWIRCNLHGLAADLG